MALSEDSKKLRAEMREVLSKIATARAYARPPEAVLQYKAACAVLNDIVCEDNS